MSFHDVSAKCRLKTDKYLVGVRCAAVAAAAVAMGKRWHMMSGRCLALTPSAAATDSQVAAAAVAVGARWHIMSGQCLALAPPAAAADSRVAAAAAAVAAVGVR